MNKLMELRNHKFIVCLTGIMLGGLIIRFINLGTFSFWIDELYHVFAAKSYLENGSLFVPFKGEYTRAFPITSIVIGMFKMFGASELTARIPFVIINLVFILFSTLLIKNWFSKAHAIFYAFVMAFSPLEILISRECRMYSPFQFAFFLFAITFWAGLENKTLFLKNKIVLPVFRWIDETLDVNSLLLLISLILFYVSAKLHKLTFNFSFIVTAYLLIQIFYLGFKKGGKNAVFSKYFLFLLLEIMTLACISLLRSDFLDFMLKTMSEIPENFKYLNPINDYHFYRYYFTDFYPALFFFFPIGSFYLINNYGKKGLFVFLAFTTLFLMHSLVFQRKADRYIFYLFPFFVLCSVSFLVHYIPVFLDNLKLDLKKFHRPKQLMLLILTIPAIYLFMHPWGISSIKSVMKEKFPDWKALPEARSLAATNGTVLAGNPNEYFYYLKKKPDSYLMLDYNRFHTYEEGKIRGFDQIKAFVDTHEDAVVVTTRFTFHNDANFNHQSRRYIENHMMGVGNTPEADILIFKKKGSS